MAFEFVHWQSHQITPTYTIYYGRLLENTNRVGNTRGTDLTALIHFKWRQMTQPLMVELEGIRVAAYVGWP